MPASDSAMGSPSMGMDSSSGGGSAKSIASGWASPEALGLIVFGMMTILLGLLFLPKPYFGSYSLVGGQIFYTGYVVAILLGIIGLISWLQGHAYWGSAFLGYAGFWAAFSYATIHGGFANGFGEAGYMFVWLLFTITFLIASFKHGWGTVIQFLFLTIAFILLVVAFWQTGSTLNLTKLTSSELWAYGGWWIFTGLVWWYFGTAKIVEKSWGRKVLPS